MINLLTSPKKVVTPFTLVILAGWVVYGAIIMISSFIHNWVPDPSLYVDPWYIEFFIGLFISVGASLIIISQHDWKKITTSWLFDKLGMTLGLGGWFGYTVSVLVVDVSRIGAASMGLLAFIALAVRFIYTYSYEQFIKDKVFRFKWMD